MTAPLIPFLAGETITADDLNDALSVIDYAVQADDQTVNNTTTFESSDDVIIPLAANGAWIFFTCVMFSATSTADFKINFDLPTGSFIRKMWGSRPALETDEATEISTRVDDDPDVFNIGASGTGAMRAVFPMGVIATSSTAGNVTLQFAQQNAEVSDATLRSGSWLVVIRYL